MRFPQRPSRSPAIGACAALLAAAPAWAGGWANPRELPQFEVGNQRLEILSRIRNDLLEAVKRRDAGDMDSLLAAGDAEFGARMWLQQEERLCLYLLLGKGEAILRDSRMREAFWRDGLESTRRIAPEFCPMAGHPSFSDIRSLGYAPDLIDHLAARLSAEYAAVMAALATHPDLADFLGLSRCEEADRRSGKDMDAGKAAVKRFLAKHPGSPLARDIEWHTRRNLRWTGNGVLAGAGAAYGWYDEATASLIPDGLEGGMFLSAHFPALMLGTDWYFREFTAQRPYRLGDSAFAAGAKGSLTRVSIQAGYGFRPFPDLFVTPFTGLLISDFGLSASEEERLDAEGFEERSYGVPIGVHVDYLAKQLDASEDIGTGLGFRLSLAYHYGNWRDAESGLGDQGLFVSANFFVGLIGMRWER